MEGGAFDLLIVCCLKHFYKMDLYYICSMILKLKVIFKKSFHTCLTSNRRKVCSKFITKN